MIDELWRGGPRFREKKGVYRVGTDSILLAHFVGFSQSKKKKRVMDLGCGSGVIAIVLACDNDRLLIDGIDIQPDAVSCATENVELSGLADRVNIIEGDLRHHREFMLTGTYDHVVANPPYYAPRSGRQSGDVSRVTARSEELCTLDDVCKAASYLLRWGGSFSLVHKPQRIADIFRALDGSGLEPKRIRFVQNKQSSPPGLVLIESRRGGSPSLKVEAPLILRDDNGNDSDEMKLIYRL